MKKAEEYISSRVVISSSQIGILVQTTHRRSHCSFVILEKVQEICLEKIYQQKDVGSMTE